MDEFVNLPPALQQAVNHYEWAINGPAMAPLLCEQIANLKAASAALRALISAAEEWSGPVVLPSMLEQRHGALLTAHQTTWTKACLLQLRSRVVEPLRSMLNDVWNKVFLQVLIDRGDRGASIHEFRHIKWIRIFGSSRPIVLPESTMVTDKITAACCVVSTRAGESSDSASVPLETTILVCDAILRYQAARQEGRPIDDSEAQRTIYSYGPIGKNDRELNLDAMRDSAASIDYIIKLMTFSSNSFRRKPISDMSYVYEYLDKENIRTNEFHKAISQVRRVERHAIEMGRSRHRRQKTAADAMQPAQRTTRTKTKAKPSRARQKASLPE